MTYEIKNADGGILDVSDTSRRVKTAINKVGVMDFDKDIMDAKAFDKTIKERGPKGTGLIWHLTDHNPSLKFAIGRPVEIGVEKDYLYFVTDIPATTWGNDMMELYKSGHVNQHSVGFSTIKREVFNDDDYTKRYTVIKEVKLYEGSAVLWGANEFTPTLSVGKSASKEEVQCELTKLLTQYESTTKLFKTGHLSDETFELLDIHMTQLNEKIKALFNLQATQADEKSLEPDGEKSEMDQLTEFTNILKLRI